MNALLLYENYFRKQLLQHRTRWGVHSIVGYTLLGGEIKGKIFKKNIRL